jgi:hypothetical protein
MFAALQKVRIFPALMMVLVSLSVSAERGVKLKTPEGGVTEILLQTAMPELGDGRLAMILTRYYHEGLGGPEHWDRISSLRVRGLLTLKDSEFELQALQRKPNFMKLTLVSNQQEWVFGHDGTTAWKRAPNPNLRLEEMADKEARRLTHGAYFGNHLLYPFAEGKEIVYIDTIPTEGKICHQVRVRTNSGFRIDYFIDIRTYLDAKVVIADPENDNTRCMIYKNYIRVHGMPIAKRVDSSENGEWVSTLVLDEIGVNRGVMPWMFKMRD